MFLGLLRVLFKSLIRKFGIDRFRVGRRNFHSIDAACTPEARKPPKPRSLNSEALNPNNTF